MWEQAFRFFLQDPRSQELEVQVRAVAVPAGRASVASGLRHFFSASPPRLSLSGFFVRLFHCLAFQGPVP